MKHWPDRLGIHILMRGHECYYPICCIAAFWADVFCEEDYVWVQRGLSGECGWVPCQNHCEVLD